MDIFCHAIVASIERFTKCELKFHEKIVCEQIIRWTILCVDMCDQKLGYRIKNKKFCHKNVEKEREKNEFDKEVVVSLYMLIDF
jgi:hypothetical protein